jgi:transposase
VRAQRPTRSTRTLARLLAGRLLPAVWLPDEQTRVLRRRISARAQLVRQRTRAKNQVHATLVRNLKGKPPVSDLFGARGRSWLAAQEPPADEQETVAGCPRQIAFLDSEIELVERTLAEQVLASVEMRRPLTLPGVNFVTAAALLAAIGDLRRFPTARQLVSYLGLDPACSSPARSRPGTGGSPSRARASPATCWSRRPGTPAGHRDRCAPSTSGSPSGAAATSPPSRSPASSP